MYFISYGNVDDEYQYSLGSVDQSCSGINPVFYNREIYAVYYTYIVCLL